MGKLTDLFLQPSQCTYVDVSIETAGYFQRVFLRVQNRDIVRSRSLVFRDAFDKALARGSTNVVISTNDDDASIIRAVLLNLQQEVATVPGDPEETRFLDTMARHCNVLWQYQCDPQPYLQMWKKNITNYHEPDRSDKQLRSWHHKQHKSKSPSRFIIALVLGLEEELVREIDILWNSPYEVITPVFTRANIEGDISTLYENV